MKQDLKYCKSLDDLAFEGRNKSYGSYYLRRKYLKYVLSSLAIAIFMLVLLAVGPFFYYYFEASDTNMTDEEMYMVDYSFMPTLEEDQSLLLKALAAPPPENTQPPVVVDSVKEVEKKVIEEPPKTEQNEEAPKSNDSVSGGREGQGQNIGDPTGIYTIIDVYPRFPGGDDARLYFLRKNIRYPEIALHNGIQGVVLLVFIIEKDGSLSHLELKRGIGGGCDEEAARVTRTMPRWEPGKRSGRPVRVMVQMPVVFKIPGKLPQ